MSPRVGLFALILALMLVGVAAAQFPLLDTMANRVVQKYQQSTCEQLWEQRGKTELAQV